MQLMGESEMAFAASALRHTDGGDLIIGRIRDELDVEVIPFFVLV